MMTESYPLISLQGLRFMRILNRTYEPSRADRMSTSTWIRYNAFLNLSNTDLEAL